MNKDIPIVKTAPVVIGARLKPEHLAQGLFSHRLACKSRFRVFIKESKMSECVEFSPTRDFINWMQMPLAYVEECEVIEEGRCGDDRYMDVHLIIKQTDLPTHLICKLIASLQKYDDMLTVLEDEKASLRRANSGQHSI